MLQFKGRNNFSLELLPPALLKGNKLDSDICNTSSNSTFKKKT